MRGLAIIAGLAALGLLLWLGFGLYMNSRQTDAPRPGLGQPVAIGPTEPQRGGGGRCRLGDNNCSDQNGDGQPDGPRR